MQIPQHADFSDASEKRIQPAFRLRLQTNIRVLMAKHGYRSVTALYKAVQATGCTISYAQFNRIVDNNTDKLNLEVLDALINLFQCGVDEIFSITTTAQR